MDSIVAEEPRVAAGEPEPSEPAAAQADGRFAVPLTVELENTTIPLERLQALREGAVLPLDAAEGVIPVRILASGRPLARGTLVSVGSGYGVLIAEEAAEG